LITVAGSLDQLVGDDDRLEVNHACLLGVLGDSENGRSALPPARR
jgi:hypothetical protein